MTKTQLQIWHPDHGGSRQEWEVALLMYRAGPHGGQRKCPECGRLFDPRVNGRAYEKVLIEQRYCSQLCVVRMNAKRNQKTKRLRASYARSTPPDQPASGADARADGAAVDTGG